MVPLDDVRRVEARRLSPRRTALVAGATVALIVVLIDSIGLVNVLGSGGGEFVPDPPDPGGG